MTEPVLGIVRFEPTVPEGTHDACYQKLNAIIDSEANPGNNILPRVPEMRHILNCPEVRGALISVLGPDYLEHPHRYCHFIPPGRDGQTWHKDDYIYDQNVRHHRGRWVMAFYYPQAVTADMGPTSIAPGHQHYDTTAQLETEESAEMPITGPAGTVAIVKIIIFYPQLHPRILGAPHFCGKS